MSDRIRGLHQGTANHKPGCACPPCKNKRYEALCLQSKELEMRVLSLTDEAANAKEGAQVLQNALNESRKISQEREKQLKEAEQKLAHFMGRANFAEVYLKTIQEALDCKNPAKLAEKAQKLQSDLSQARVDDNVLRQDRDALATELNESQTDRDRYTALLSQISGKLSDCCEWDELPLAVESLLQRCNQYGERSDAMGKANTQLQQERDEAQAALKLANASIESLQRGNEQLGREVDTLTDEVGKLTPLLPPWARIFFTLVGLVAVALVWGAIGYQAGREARP